MFSESVAYKKQYAVKGENNESLLLKQGSKYFALSKNLNKRRLNINEGCMAWTMYDFYTHIIWFINIYLIFWKCWLGHTV